MQATNANPIHCIKKKTSQRSSKLVTVLEKIQAVSNLAVRTSGPHCLLKMSHLVNLAHTCHLLVGHQRIQRAFHRKLIQPQQGASTGMEKSFLKRDKLRKWVVETSYPHIEELCSKGYDFVSLLLSRLFPESNKNSGFKKSKSREIDIDTKSQFLTSLELHSQQGTMWNLTMFHTWMMVLHLVG